MAIVTLAAWNGALRVPFHFDDWPNIVLDPATSDAAVLAQRMTSGIRPLVRASWFLDDAIGGMRPLGFHVTNLLIHLATVLGVWALARRRIGEPIAAFLAALIFSLQPANTEVVAYVTGRSTGLATLFIVLALLCHEKAERSWRWRIGEALAFVAAVLSKEIAIVYLALAWLWDVTKAAPSAIEPAPEKKRSEEWRESVVLASAAAVATFVLLTLPRYRELATYSFRMRGPLHSLALNARAVPAMVTLWARPWALCIDHAFDAGWRPLASALGALAILGVATLGALAWSHARHPGAVRRPMASLFALAIFWTLAALAPTNSFVARRDPISDHSLYLAWVGVSIFLGAWIARFTPPWRNRVSASLLAAMAIFTVSRVETWRDPRRVWLEAVVEGPRRARAWNNLGNAFLVEHDRRTALRAFRRAVELDPHDRKARMNLERLESGRND